MKKNKGSEVQNLETKDSLEAIVEDHQILEELEAEELFEHRDSSPFLYEATKPAKKPKGKKKEQRGEKRLEKRLDTGNTIEQKTEEKLLVKPHPVIRQCLCKLIKGNMLQGNFHGYQELVRDPQYLCGKCGRAAREKINLCKPIKITGKE